jgi:hypothetical protein
MDPEDGEDFDDIQDFDDTEDQQQDTDQSEDQQDLETHQDLNAGDDEEEIEEQPARRPSRAQARIEALDRELREARERAAEAERLAREALNGQTRTNTAEQERAERERLAQMDPWDRQEYLRRKDVEESRRQLGSLQAQIADSTDRAEFAAACAANAALAKVKDKVEAELTKLRANGQTVPRQTLAAYLIGQQVLEKAPKARERAAKKAAGNLDRERARPAGGASDAPRGRDKDERAARDKRLEDYTF